MPFDLGAIAILKPPTTLPLLSKLPFHPVLRGIYIIPFSLNYNCLLRCKNFQHGRSRNPMTAIFIPPIPRWGCKYNDIVHLIIVLTKKFWTDYILPSLFGGIKSTIFYHCLLRSCETPPSCSTSQKWLLADSFTKLAISLSPYDEVFNGMINFICQTDQADVLSLDLLVITLLMASSFWRCGWEPFKYCCGWP